MAWQTTAVYIERAIVEAQIGRCKPIMGNTLKARKIYTENTKIRTATQVLELMTVIGRTEFQRVCHLVGEGDI